MGKRWVGSDEIKKVSHYTHNYGTNSTSLSHGGHSQSISIIFAFYINLAVH